MQIPTLETARLILRPLEVSDAPAMFQWVGDPVVTRFMPYNTYTRKGLPVGPICNPSMDAVVAALYPDEQYVAQKYLYFCSTDPSSGELHFSKTLKEHEAAVAMYRPLWEEYDRSRGLE